MQWLRVVGHQALQFYQAHRYYSRRRTLDDAYYSYYMDAGISRYLLSLSLFLSLSLSLALSLSFGDPPPQPPSQPPISDFFIVRAGDEDQGTVVSDFSYTLRDRTQYATQYALAGGGKNSVDLLFSTGAQGNQWEKMAQDVHLPSGWNKAAFRM